MGKLQELANKLFGGPPATKRQHQTLTWEYPRSRRYLDHGYEYNPDVYAVVSGIARAAAAVPPIVLRFDDDQKRREYKNLKQGLKSGVSSTYLDKLKFHRQQATIQELDGLLRKPNPLQAWPEFIENLIGFKLLRGEGFIHGVRSTDDRILELWNLPPKYVQLQTEGGPESGVQAYKISMHTINEVLGADDVMHIKFWNPDYSSPGSHMRGMSPLEAATRSIRSGNDGLTALSRAFQNNGAAGMLFPKEQSTLTEEQKQQIRSYFAEKGGGPENYKSVLAFSAEMGWKQFGVSPVDLEVIEAKKMSARDIANVYGYPSELLNDPDNKTFENKRQARKQLYQDLVIPELERLYAELNRFLRPNFDENVVLDFDTQAIEPLHEDTGNKVDWLEKAWWISPAKKAEIMNVDAPDDDIFSQPWVPTNMMPASMVAPDVEMDEDEVRSLLEEYGQKQNGNTIHIDDE